MQGILVGWLVDILWVGMDRCIDRWMVGRFFGSFDGTKTNKLKCLKEHNKAQAQQFRVCSLQERAEPSCRSSLTYRQATTVLLIC